LVSLVAARPRSARANTSNAAPSSSRCSLPPHCARPRPQRGAPPPKRDRPHRAGQWRAPQGTQLRGYHGRAPVRCSHARCRRAPRWRGRRRAPRCPRGRRPLRRVSGAPSRSWRRTGRRAAPATWPPPRPWRTGPARGCSTSGPCGWAGPARSRPARPGAALAHPSAALHFGSPLLVKGVLYHLWACLPLRVSSAYNAAPTTNNPENSAVWPTRLRRKTSQGDSQSAPACAACYSLATRTGA